MIPVLETERLILRPFEVSDSERVQLLFGDRKIAETTLIVPHPFPEEKALQWIDSHKTRASDGTASIFAVALNSNNELIGTTMLRVDKEHNRGELSYWFGVPYWGQGYATEAALTVIEYGFQQLNLNKIFAAAMTKNPSSIRVMKKLGLRYEGTFYQHVLKWGKYEDLSYYAILRSQYQQSANI